MSKFYLKFLVAGLAAIFILPFIAYFLSPVNASGRAVYFTVEKGDGFREIARSLKDSALIKSPSAFVIYAALTGSAHKLKPGVYKLSPAMNLPKILSTLKKGAEDIEVVIQEGQTLAEVEKELADLKILPKKKLLKYPGRSLEGFLFPDTYRFFASSTADEVVKKFLANFGQKAMPVLSQAKGDFYKTLIMASIIEKEIPFSEDRPIVAGILYKRLKIGMGLQVDAAPETYDHAGLPSKPIANPGLDAIRAAVYPKSSEYLYYLSDPATKKTIFAKTFEEHKENKWRYLKK